MSTNQPLQLSSAEVHTRLLTALKDSLQRTTGANFTGHFVALESCSSTMDVAKQIASESNTPAIVLSAEQTQGRGRNQRVWNSPARSGLYVTYVLDSSRDVSELMGLSLVVGIAVHEAAYQLGADATLKWPNDIWGINEKGEVTGKLAGILIETQRLEKESESSPGVRISIGIGMNISGDLSDAPFRGETLLSLLPPPLQTEPLELYTSAFGEVSAQILAAVSAFERVGIGPFLEPWVERSVMIGREASVERDGATLLTGTAVGINERGGLVLRLADGRDEVVYSNEVTVTRW